MAESVTLVISGKTYPDVPKEVLINNSSYFSGLLSGKFGDSFSSSYKFNLWSTSAFEIVLRYIRTGRIELKGTTNDMLKTAMDMCDFLIIDGFRPQLARTLVYSWTEMNSESVFELAEELGVLQKLQEYSFVKVFSIPEQENPTAVIESINHDILVFVTGTDAFFKIRMDKMESFSEVWEEAVRRYRLVLDLAAGLAPNGNKLRALIRNLRLRNWNRHHWSAILKSLGPKESVSRYFKNVLEEVLMEERQQIRKKLSYVRFAFRKGGGKLETLGILEFRLDGWTWEIKEYREQFSSSCCVMNRDYATFLGRKGLFVIRKRNRNPVTIENVSLGEKVSGHCNGDVVCCVSGKSLFVLVQRDNGQVSKLFEFDFFAKTFTDCADVPAKRARLKGDGDRLYIVGYSFDEFLDLCVFEYQIKTKDVWLVARTSDYGFPVNFLSVIKRKLYILSDDAYTSVDTSRGGDQLVETETYKGFVPEMWEFTLLQVCSASDGLLLLLRVTCTDWDYNDFMVANFNPVNGEVTCLGILPTMATEHYDVIRNLLPGCDYLPQMETRKSRNAALPNNDDVSKKLKRMD